MAGLHEFRGLVGGYLTAQDFLNYFQPAPVPSLRYCSLSYITQALTFIPRSGSAVGVGTGVGVVWERPCTPATLQTRPAPSTMVSTGTSSQAPNEAQSYWG